MGVGAPPGENPGSATEYGIQISQFACLYQALLEESMNKIALRIRVCADDWTAESSGGSRISPRRGRQLPKGAPTYDFAKFSQKLHEIERIWTRGGASLPPPLDPPLERAIIACNVADPKWKGCPYGTELLSFITVFLE